MPVTIKMNKMHLKKDDGTYIGINTVAERTTDEMKEEIEAKGEEVIASIPEDYQEMTKKMIVSKETIGSSSTVPRDADTLGGRITASDVDTNTSAIATLNNNLVEETLQLNGYKNPSATFDILSGSIERFGKVCALQRVYLYIPSFSSGNSITLFQNVPYKAKNSNRDIFAMTSNGVSIGRVIITTDGQIDFNPNTTKSNGDYIFLDGVYICQ